MQLLRLPDSTTNLDHTIDVETPELVLLSYTVAGVATRLLAGLIDFAICVVAVTLCAIASIAAAPSLAGTAFLRSAAWAMSILVVAQFLIVWGYYVAFEGLRDGQTPGKRWLGLRVVQDGGYSVSLGASAIRNLMRIIDLQPGIFAAVGIISIVATKSGKRLGDIVAGTIVVRERPLMPRVTLKPNPAVRTGERRTGNNVLTDGEFAVLDRFMERRASLVASERARIAAQLSSLFRPRMPAANGNDASFLARLFADESQGRLYGSAGRNASGASRERHAIVAEGTERWEQFAVQVAYAQKHGLKRLKAVEVRNFVAGYRELSNDLARLRTASRGGDPTEVFRLSRLVAAGHNQIYRGARIPLTALVAFLGGDVPREVRRSWAPIALAACMLFGPMAVAYTAVITRPSVAASFVPLHMIERAEGGAMRAKAGRGYVDDPEAGRPLMGSLIIVNNLQVAFVAFALGITGIGTVMTLVFNGVLFGGVLGVYSVKGIAQLILAFVAPHGVLELSAIAIAGGAGLLLTTALLLPGKQTRRDALVTNAKRALKLIVCAILFMSIAGMLEGFVSPIPWWPIEWKAMVALATLVVMILYLTLGRTRPSTVLPAT